MSNSMNNSIGKKKDGKIHFPSRTKGYLQPGQQAVVRVTPEAYNALVDICNQTHLPQKIVVSEIITQSLDRIVFDEEEN